MISHNKIGWVLVFLAVNIVDSSGNVCDTEICRQMAREIKDSINTSTNPCEDFSEFVCGNFGKTHAISPGESSSNAFSQIDDKIINTLHDLLEKQPLSLVHLPQTKAAIFYRSCMNKFERDRTSENEIHTSIKTLDENASYDDTLATFLEKAISSRIVAIDLTLDSKNPRYFILKIDNPRLILSVTTLKSPELARSKKQIDYYKTYMNKVLDIMGLWIGERDVVNDIVDLNIEVAQALPSLPDRRNPDKSYNKMTISALQTRCSEISWKYVINRVLNGSGKSLSDNDHIIVFSLPYLDRMCEILRSYKYDEKLKRVLYRDMIWAELNGMVPMASDRLVKANDELRANLYGIKGQTKLWKLCVKETSNNLVDIMSNMYIKQNFDLTKKKDITNMLVKIRKVLKEVIENATWMDGGTKSEAIKKLHAIRQKVGYPEYVLNETKLTLESAGLKMDQSNFVGNYYSLKKFDSKNSMKLCNSKIPSDKWFIGAHQVNAYYSPWTNEIVFPAAILQYPFYDIGLPITSKYGGVGMVIGHEILHGFDTLGSKFDHNGLLREWWTKESRQKYVKKAKCIQEQYGNYSIYGEELQAKQTIGEDVADNAGLRMAYMASQMSTEEKTTLPGLSFTPEQLFFIQEAWIWCSHTTEKSILEYVKTNVHSVWKFRINGPLSNMPEFSEAFKCNYGHKMNRINKCLVW